jgi:F-type H+-transporting ATPase subunit b
VGSRSRPASNGMESLLEHLGINWKLLVAQGANFFVLVILLNQLLYKPLVNLINERRKKIEEGLRNADTADKRLEEAELMKQEEILKGERAGLVIMEDAQKEGQNYKDKARKEAEVEAEAMKRKTEDLGRRLIQREMENLEKNSKELIEKAISEAVGLNPAQIDKKLVEDAMLAIKKLRV